MSYAELLMDIKWQEKRERIISRDNNCCVGCKNFSQLPKLEFGVFHSVNHAENKVSIIIDVPLRPIKMNFLPNHKNLILKDCIYYFYNEKGRKFLVGIRKMTIQELEAFGKPVTMRDLLNLHVKSLINSTNISFNELVEQIDFENRFNKLNTIFEQLDTTKVEWMLFTGLHVHHTFYQCDKLPWEYPDDSLQTLCIDCHNRLHYNQTIPVLDKNGIEIGKYHYCSRCNGAGWFPKYIHVNNGICFKCRGVKYEELIEN